MQFGGNHRLYRILEGKLRTEPIAIWLRFYAQLNKDKYKRYCSLLGVAENYTEDDLRTAFIKLAKRFHPDSQTKEANAEKFKKIETAFRELKTVVKTKVEETEIIVHEADIKHTAPQHRQYLSFEGVGSGTPYQRQKEYEKKRAIDAADNVLQHRITKQSVTPSDKQLSTKHNTSTKHKIKTKYGLDRLVEDLIQESMSKGEFNNLKGFGKPLENRQNVNPYLDFTTHKLNQVLIESGFTPEWISLQKDIREETLALKNKLKKECQRFTFPLSEEDETKWESMLRKHRKSVEDINKKIQNFNLVVPILQKQMVTLRLEKMVEKILEEKSVEVKEEEMEKSGGKEEGTVKRWKESRSLFKFIASLINF